MLHVSFILLLLGLAPLRVHNAKRRHQSSEWTILSHVNCFIQEEVIGFEVLLDSLHPCSMQHPGGLLQFFKVEAVNIFGIWFYLESVFCS